MSPYETYEKIIPQWNDRKPTLRAIAKKLAKEKTPESQNKENKEPKKE